MNVIFNYKKQLKMSRLNFKEEQKNVTFYLKEGQKMSLNLKEGQKMSRLTSKKDKKCLI